MWEPPPALSALYVVGVTVSGWAVSLLLRFHHLEFHSWYQNPLLSCYCLKPIVSKNGLCDGHQGRVQRRKGPREGRAEFHQRQPERHSFLEPGLCLWYSTLLRWQKYVAFGFGSRYLFVNSSSLPRTAENQSVVYFTCISREVFDIWIPGVVTVSPNSTLSKTPYAYNCPLKKRECGHAHSSVKSEQGCGGSSGGFDNM